MLVLVVVLTSLLLLLVLMALATVVRAVHARLMLLLLRLVFASRVVAVGDWHLERLVVGDVVEYAWRLAQAHLGHVDRNSATLRD